MAIDINCNIKRNSYQLNFHGHEKLELYYFQKGSCNFQVGNQFYSLQPNDLLLIDGGILHGAFVPKDGGQQNYIRSVIHFDRDDLYPILKSFERTDLLDMFAPKHGHLYRLRNNNDQMMVDKRLEELARLENMKVEANISAKIRLMLILLLLDIEVSDRVNLFNQKEVKSEKLVQVEELTKFITYHYDDPLTIREIAKGVNLSPSYAASLFKEVTGLTIMNFLMTYRLTQANFKLIERDDLTIYEIAQHSGFKSDAHFNRFFKKNMGVTPLQYRNHHKNKIKIEGE